MSKLAILEMMFINKPLNMWRASGKVADVFKS